MGNSQLHRHVTSGAVVNNIIHSIANASEDVLVCSDVLGTADAIPDDVKVLGHIHGADDHEAVLWAQNTKRRVESC